MNKRKNIKIKRRKYRLYQKKKSKGRKALTIILTIAGLAALCILGYGLGRPLVEYFQNKGNESGTSSSWTPPVSAETSGSSGEITEQVTTEPVAEPEVEITKTVYILPENALASSDSLNSALAAAKNSGCTDVAVTLKNEAGLFLYKSGIDGAVFMSDDESTPQFSLTARQICDAIKAAGFAPQARINTLLDKNTKLFEGEYICYMLSSSDPWHDYVNGRVDKSWLDPFNPGTAKFLSAVIGELCGSGFGKVTLANTKYPVFQPRDLTEFLSHTKAGDQTARLEALWNVIDSCNAAAAANGAELLLEMTDSDIFADSQKFTTAEAAGNPEKLKSVTLLIDYTPEGTAGYTQAKALIGRLGVQFSGQSAAVRLKGAGFSTAVAEDIKRAFSEANITVYSE